MVDFSHKHVLYPAKRFSQFIDMIFPALHGVLMLIELSILNLRFPEINPYDKGVQPI